MGFLTNLFGKKDPLQAMGKAIRQQGWAEALSYVDEIDAEGLTTEAREDFERWRSLAGDRLAEYNLAEGDACRSAGDLERAAEHFSLARESAVAEVLRSQAAAELAGLGRVEPVAQAKSSSCSTCQPQVVPQVFQEHDLPDAESRLELLLCTLPEEMAARYRETPEEFLLGLLQAHDGDEPAALSRWDRIPEAARDSIYWLEVGGAEARLAHAEKAEAALQRAIEAEPGLAPAWQMLVEVQLVKGDRTAVSRSLERMRADGISPAFCFGQIARLEMEAGRRDRALEAGLQALRHPGVEGDTLVLCAFLLEESGRLEEAEQLLVRLPAAKGCGGGGGVHPLLAEFWLRRRKELDRALEGFKAALRQEPDNLRWNMRIAQAYLARGWKKEGLQGLRNVLQNPALPAGLRQEGEAWLAEFA